MNNIIRIVEANANRDVCGPCGGACCKGAPGAFLPTDLSPTLNREEILDKGLDMLISGNYSLYYYERDFAPLSSPGIDIRTIWVLRPANKGREGVMVERSWYFGCVFHNDNGCSLSDQQRPAECKSLIPKGGLGVCAHGELKKPYASFTDMLIDEWVPFQDIVEQWKELEYLD